MLNSKFCKNIVGLSWPLIVVWPPFDLLHFLLIISYPKSPPVLWIWSILFCMAKAFSMHIKIRPIMFYGVIYSSNQLCEDLRLLYGRYLDPGWCYHTTWATSISATLSTLSMMDMPHIWTSHSQFQEDGLHIRVYKKNYKIYRIFFLFTTLFTSSNSQQVWSVALTTSINFTRYWSLKASTEKIRNFFFPNLF